MPDRMIHEEMIMKECYVETRFGRIRGWENEYGREFHSIPYAVTERFEEPREVPFWGEFDATQRQVNCHQRFEYYDEKAEDGFYFREFDYMRFSDWAESPMTLSILTPKQPENCPVVMYFHGGAFENGCIDDEPFGSSHEFTDRGIIQVSVGYRLNVFGLYGSENFGLQDMEYAIHWVRDNIEAFGGDGSHIVLMGQSAGAMGVADLLLDNRLIGLISGAIMMSGAGLVPKFAGPAPREQNQPFWDEVREKCGCKTDDELKKVDARKLWQTWYDCKQASKSLQVGVPAIDGKIIRDYPHEIARRDEDVNVPLLIGVTSQDMFPFMIFELAYGLALNRSRRKLNPVYGYYFDVTPPGESYKAFHAADLWYMFGNMEKSWRPFTDEDRQISKTMIDYTANFIKTGNPNGEGLKKWPAFTRLRGRFRLFSRTWVTLTTPAFARGKLLRNFLFDRGPF
ncbi:MAG: carboxylesterase family protein [Erysipelotrichaceae bacterium]|nr:carboxylesterase family protein [Erysipelotrichaceae bacterium]